MSGKQKEKKPAGKRKRTVLAVLAVVLLLVVAVLGITAYKFRSHIKSAVIFMTTSREDIEVNIDKAKDEQSEALKNIGFNASKELDDALQSGLITPEEHTQILLGNISLDEVLANNQETNEDTLASPDDTQNVPAHDGQGEKEETITVVPDETDKPVDTADKDNAVVPEKNDNAKDNQQKPAAEDKPKLPADKNNNKGAASGTDGTTGTSSDVDGQIAGLVTKLYVLKSEYTGSINGVIASMKADYAKLPAEQRTTSAKASIASGYLGQINAMEAQCDAQVNAIIADLRKILSDNGRDTSLADNILAAYATEKENTKAYYISTYGD